MYTLPHITVSQKSLDLGKQLAFHWIHCSRQVSIIRIPRSTVYAFPFWLQSIIKCKDWQSTSSLISTVPPKTCLTETFFLYAPGMECQYGLVQLSWRSVSATKVLGWSVKALTKRERKKRYPTRTKCFYFAAQLCILWLSRASGVHGPHREPLYEPTDAISVSQAPPNNTPLPCTPWGSSRNETNTHTQRSYYLY